MVKEALIKISMKTKLMLDKKGKKGETYEDVILKLIHSHAIKARQGK